VSTYHRVLVWDIEKAPKVTRYADRLLNPLVGKSLVVYLQKPAGSDAGRATVPEPTSIAAPTTVTEPPVSVPRPAPVRVGVA
jgi:hypothetical protein